MLRVRAFKPTFVSVSNRQIEAVGNGIRESGDDFEITNDLDEEADVALCVSGSKYPGTQLWEHRRKIEQRFGMRRLTTESAIFRENGTPHEGEDPYFRLSVGGFMRTDGIYSPPNFFPSDTRWEILRKEQGLKLEPWRKWNPQGSVLICMQKPNDASLCGVDTWEWTKAKWREIRNVTDMPIVVRRHPLDKSGAGDRLPGFASWCRAKTLREALKGVSCLVTHTSISAVEAVMAGVPVFCSEPNHAYPVSCGSNVALLQSPTPGHERINREPWVYGLAYTQWKLSELREGGPWRRLRQLLKG